MWVNWQMNSVKWYHDRDARCDSFKDDSVRTVTCNSIVISTFASLCSLFQSQMACFCSLHTNFICYWHSFEMKANLTQALLIVLLCFISFMHFHTGLIFYKYWLIIGLPCLHRSYISILEDQTFVHGKLVALASIVTSPSQFECVQCFVLWLQKNAKSSIHVYELFGHCGDSSIYLIQLYCEQKKK